MHPKPRSNQCPNSSLGYVAWFKVVANRYLTKIALYLNKGVMTCMDKKKTMF